MSLSEVPPGRNVPQEVNVVIEIPAETGPVKYEVDKVSGAIFVDRFMNTAMFYPCNYGYVPGTLAEDADPLDVLVISPSALLAGCVIAVRPVGVLRMTDEAGDDAKILAVPVGDLTVEYEQVREPQDVNITLRNRIEHFFAHYKDLEEGKWVRLDGWGDAEEARRIVLESIERHHANQ